MSFLTRVCSGHFVLTVNCIQIGLCCALCSYYPDSFDSFQDCDANVADVRGALDVASSSSSYALPNALSTHAGPTAVADHGSGAGGPWVSGGRTAPTGFFGPLQATSTDLFSALTAGRCGMDESPALDFPPLPLRCALFCFFCFMFQPLFCARLWLWS